MSNPLGGPAAPRPSLGGKIRPALTLEAIEKAKKALQLQQQIQEKLKSKLPQIHAKIAETKLESTDKAATPTPGINPKIALAAQKAAEIAARLSSTLAPVVASAAIASSPSLPKPLRVNAQGLEIDENGDAVRKPTFSSSLTSPLLSASTAAATINLPTPTVEEVDPFFDPRLGDRAAQKMGRRLKRGFNFSTEGKFSKEADLMRLKAQYGSRWTSDRRDGSSSFKPRVANSNFTQIGSNLVPLGKRVAVEEPEAIPTDPSLQAAAETAALTAALMAALGTSPAGVEWWDKPILLNGSYSSSSKDTLPNGNDSASSNNDAQASNNSNNNNNSPPSPPTSSVPIKEAKITIYIEHPVLKEPPLEPPVPPPQPLKLTASEVKKLRTQRRLAREREKQELIRQGLLEPAKPKVKISNLHRVLGTDVTLDPTAVDLEVRRQMAERQAAHEDRNVARMLTPAERRSKKIRKLFDQDPDSQITCSVYRVSRLDHFMNRLKVEMNAKENRMSGLVVCVKDGIGVVAVEGCPKSTKRYLKLMLRRIDWNSKSASNKNSMEEDMEEDEDDEDKPLNTCHLVW
eukprot:CAMPEP_0175070536 /NCGR_PEP_ID=MMETSP0052_2-20121109/18767_1 /TAXON_ID=51329 ORGANISM="Polytomella parva, Strain SAG 63-3" /NCGR_SAMPLE_ID=MMETSP0052_2 /ASSEMBLY_ACC=CAM_ASM_000194 /LENGTH=572 /DNA_ID=CAMNT_0016337657 /DNA_START=15 /DNA_END=1730 /DNA_ORIENTATION=-